MCGDVGEPSLWLADGLGQDTCFLESGFLFTIGANSVTRAKAPQFKISDRNVYMSAISFNNFVTALRNNNRCKQKFDKLDLKDHVKNCVYICPWRGDGCGVTNTRKEKHEAHIRKHKSMLNPEDYDHMDI